MIPELVIGVASREFEAWLISDEAAVRAAASKDFSFPGNPEGLEPRAAKDLLRGLIRSSPRAGEESIVRREIVEKLDLDLVAKRCRSFQNFREDLRNPPPTS